MTKSYEECMLQILANPEDDRARTELARAIEASDPDRAEFLKLQLNVSANVRRMGPKNTSFRERELYLANSVRWSRDLAFYTSAVSDGIQFHRGLPWQCRMNAYTFLEYGEYVFSRVAPLRGITFCADPDGDPFPIEQLSASPLLRRLDMIAFHRNTLAPGQLETLLASPNLERVLSWDIRDNPVTLATYEAFAANPLTRRALVIDSDFQVPSDKGPIGEVSANFDIYPWRHFDVSSEGAALEKQYGYLPWLHIGNHCGFEDAQYWVQTKVLPLFEPGSPADAPAPIGKGLGARPPLEPRTGFELEAFNAMRA